MLTMELVILTKSSKYGRNCVAGIDLRTREWVRLVSSDETSDGAVSDEEMTYGDGRVVAPLDVIRTDIEGWKPLGCQEENAVICEGRRWTPLGRMNVDEVLKIFREPAPKFIFGDTNRYISVDTVGELHHSLLMAEVSELRIYRNEKNKMKCDFLYNGYQYHALSVTDPEYYKYEMCDIGKAHIVVSLPHKDYEGKYYKFVAKIFAASPPTHSCLV